MPGGPPGTAPAGAQHGAPTVMPTAPRRGAAPTGGAVERPAVHRPDLGADTPRRRHRRHPAGAADRPVQRVAARSPGARARPLLPPRRHTAPRRPQPRGTAPAWFAGSARRTARRTRSPRPWHRGRWSRASTRCAARWRTAASAGSTSPSTATSTTAGWCSRASSTRTTRPRSPRPAPSASSWPSSATPTSSRSTTSSGTSRTTTWAGTHSRLHRHGLHRRVDAGPGPRRPRRPGRPARRPRPHLHDQGAARAGLPARGGARLQRLQARQRHAVRAAPHA